MLNIVHCSGGDSPLVAGLAIFDAGLVRYSEPGRRSRWARLSAGELSVLREKVAAPAFGEAISALRREPDCCDGEWVALELERGAGTLDDLDHAPTLMLPVPKIDAGMQEVLDAVRRISERHFNRKFPDSKGLWPVG